MLAELKPAADDVRSWDLARLHRVDDLMRHRLTASSRESLLISWLEGRSLNETLFVGLEADHAVRASDFLAVPRPGRLGADGRQVLGDVDRVHRRSGQRQLHVFHDADRRHSRVPMAMFASGFWSRSTAKPYLRLKVRIGPSKRRPFPWSQVKSSPSSGRLPYQLLADAMASQYPPHRQLLEQANLKLPNGGCCLPVAYILSYALLEEGQIGDWISRLKEVLDDGSITGDQRVEWLLAREAEEVRRARRR